jgi:ketosteroid isomerase-like protein
MRTTVYGIPPPGRVVPRGIIAAMFSLRPFALLAVVPFFISCAPSSSPDARASEEAVIRALDEQWSATAAKNDVDRTVSYYADDAVLLPPNASMAADRKSVRESWAGLLGPNTSVSWQATKIEVAKSGELGYLYGTYQLSIKDPKGGPTINDKGKLVEVWKKRL